MATAPDTSPVLDEDDDETPPTPEQLLVDLGELYTRAMASPHPASPEAMGWQMVAASAVAGFTRALHALAEQDPTAAARVAAVYHGPFGEGPSPQVHTRWLERFVARSPEVFQQWVDEGRKAAATSALLVMDRRDPAALEAIVRAIASPEPCVELEGRCRTHGWKPFGACPHGHAQALLTTTKEN